MRSPTGHGIRIDAEGDGNLGAPRGDRIHAGIDFFCRKGQHIVAPFNMRIIRNSYPNADLIMNGIAWKFGKSEGRLFYFIPLTRLIGKDVSEGQIIGSAQSVSEYYQLPKMNDHVHFEVRRAA